MMREAITTDYADGFRAGWRAAIEAAARAADRQESKWAAAERWEGAVSAGTLSETLRALEPPAPMREPTGLEERGA